MLSQGWHVPGLLPDRHSLVLQAMLLISSHWYPLVVPLQVPVRRCPVGHVTLSHALHVKLLVVPLQEPLR